MQLLNAKTAAALLITSALSIGTASAADLNTNKGNSSGTDITENRVEAASPDAFIDVKAAVASRFNSITFGANGLSARQLAQKDLLNRSARLASNNL